MAEKELDVYIGGNQLTTCPKCGLRTEFVDMHSGRASGKPGVLRQLHSCVNENAKIQAIFKWAFER